MRVDSQLEVVLQNGVSAAGFELWGAELVNSEQGAVLRVFIDSIDGVGVDDCAKASRQISAVMEVENVNLDRYILEVSSPGMYRPLFILEHYQKYIGDNIKLRLKHANALNRKNFSGQLIQADDGGVAVVVDGENYLFELPEIANAHLDPDIFKSKSKAK